MTEPSARPTTPVPHPAAPQAVLWDFDGTLADTEPLWLEAEHDLVNSLGFTWDESHVENLIGNAIIDTGRYIITVIDRPDLDPQWVADELLRRVVDRMRQRPIPWKPGALELLAALRRAGIPCALVSSSYRRMLDAALSQLPEGSFAATVAGDEVVHGKPSPEPYERACRLLGVSASHCVVLEDSRPGAASGNAAGALVVAVEGAVAIPPAPRRVRVASMTELTPERLRSLLADAEASDLAPTSPSTRELP